MWVGGVSSYLALLQIIIPATYLVCALVGFRLLRSSNRRIGFALLFTSITGLGIFPQSMHRADLQHLLQVIFPFFMTTALLPSACSS